MPDPAGLLPMTQWNGWQQPYNPSSTSPYDFGWVDEQGRIHHMNHEHNPNGIYWSGEDTARKAAKVIISNMAHWVGPNPDRPGGFNNEAWCVSCDGGRHNGEDYSGQYKGPIKDR